MLVSEIFENRVVTISGGKPEKGFKALDFNQMLSQPKTKKDKEFKALNVKKRDKKFKAINYKKDAPEDASYREV